MEGITTPLKMNLVNGFNMLKTSGKNVLNPRKLGAIIECAATAPSVKGKAYSDDTYCEESIQIRTHGRTASCNNTL